MRSADTRRTTGGGPRATALLLATLLLTACADAGGPLAPELAPAEAAVPGALTGSYESRSPVSLASGESVYLVGVYFGDGAKADGRTYTAQVGVQGSAGARLILAQRTYSIAGGGIAFSGVLERGTLSPDGSVLHAVVAVSGEKFEIALRKK